jgi:hypothetical protein
MPDNQQNLGNHRRFYPLYHFVLQPILLINFFVEILRLNKYQTRYHVWLVILAFALLLLSTVMRVMVLRVQNRIIRLEERLRLTRLMPETDRALIDKLPLRQLIALRFASDEEAPDLARRCIAGELTEPAEIKKSVRNWRPDFLRV